MHLTEYLKNILMEGKFHFDYFMSLFFLVIICNVDIEICRRPGGDRIYWVFDNQLPAALRKLPFDRHLSLQNVKRIVSQADGYQPHLIAPEQGYRRLIESGLSYFRGPAEASVDAVRFLLPVVAYFAMFLPLSPLLPSL